MPAKVEATASLPGLSPVAGKRIVARFDGGRLSFNGGLLALREIEQRLGIADRLAGCINDPRAPERTLHGLDEIIRFRMLMIAAGYESGRPVPKSLFTFSRSDSDWKFTSLNKDIAIPAFEKRIGNCSTGSAGGCGAVA